jgi:NAD-dependent SIR2 family protein deacetylase
LKLGRLFHANNMRCTFKASGGHDLLLKLTEGKSTFVHTSNVDDAFVKAGFDPSIVYTPQGVMGMLQCRSAERGMPCKRTSAWDGKIDIDAALPHRSAVTGELAEKHQPKCPTCGGKTSLNLRGGCTVVQFFGGRRFRVNLPIAPVGMLLCCSTLIV